MALLLFDGITISFRFTSRAMICPQCNPPQQDAAANDCGGVVGVGKVGRLAVMAGWSGMAVVVRLPKVAVYTRG